MSSRRSINRSISLNRLLVNGEFELRVKYPSLRSYFHHWCVRGSLYARQFPYDRWVCVCVCVYTAIERRMHAFRRLNFGFRVEDDEIDDRVS